MNIFVTDMNQAGCARMLDDQRLVKMVLETAQMLSTVSGGPYKPTHTKHPCTLWVGETRQNYWWTIVLFGCLCNEYTFRYKRHHKCESHAPTFQAHVQNLPYDKLTVFANCSGFNTGNIFDDYRECMRFKWLTQERDPRWTYRNPPIWSGIGSN